MNWLDLSILILLLIFTLIGLIRGFIKQLFSICAIVGGILAGAILYKLAGDMLTKNGLINNSDIAGILGFIVVMFFSYIIIQLLGWITHIIIGNIKLSWINRIGGGVLGLSIGFIIVLFAYSTTGIFISEKSPAFKSSVLLPYIKETSVLIKKTIPKDLKDKLNRSKKLIKEKGIKSALNIKETEIKNPREEKKGY